MDLFDWLLFAVIMAFLLLSLANAICRCYFREKEKFVDRLMSRQQGDCDGEG